MRSFFPRLLGNEETKLRVGSAIENATVPHAFLIGGASGTGKSVLALEMAAAVNCEKKSDGRYPLPCGQCDRCRRIYEGNFPDLKILSKKKDKVTVGVDEIKSFRDDMFLSSTESDYKIYIIDDAESMTVEAQNALLKVLEEPPSAVMIILLAKECDRILTTIKSRVQYLSMSLFENDELIARVTEKNPLAKTMMRDNRKSFEGIIMSADGKIGAVEKLLEHRLAEENAKEREETVKLIRALAKRNAYAETYAAVTSLPTKRNELAEALERITTALRDIMVIRYGKNVKMLFFPSKDAAKAVGDGIDITRLISIYDAVNDAHSQCMKNANIQNLLVNLTAKARDKKNY